MTSIKNFKINKQWCLFTDIEEDGVKKTSGGFFYIDNNKTNMIARQVQILRIGQNWIDEGFEEGDWLLLKHNNWTKPFKIFEEGVVRGLKDTHIEHSILLISKEKFYE